jgi:hypothetical protein
MDTYIGQAQSPVSIGLLEVVPLTETSLMDGELERTPAKHC